MSFGLEHNGSDGASTPQLTDRIEPGSLLAQGFLFSRPVPAEEIPALAARSLLPATVSS